MRSRLSKSESNVFRDILTMPKSEITKKYLKNVCINLLGNEISENHLSTLKWSLNKYWSWKVWILSIQMPCRTHFSEPWMWSFIISNEKVSYLHLEVLPENRRISFLHSTNSSSDFVCCLKVSKIFPRFRILKVKISAISSCF